ncbi:hypothetical protein GLV94_05425 [Virgibacillus halodenitrificans]|uniref:hypothetical protein n=1 Tax=Virgibacillus halodenitrificans TaxID=1482 RepID=UPI001370E470|nr:hypothetical protein [Virgibacillus halodenitrificans]MYL45076.1 hypothetical protein [Virgibacillus halodenitrificans]
MDQQIKEYISLPLAINVFKHDRPLFKDFSMGNLYLSKIDHVIKQMENDFNQIKRKYYNRVRKLDNAYIIDGRKFTFTADQLREMTSEVALRYMTGDKATEFEIKNITPYTESPDIN